MGFYSGTFGGYLKRVSGPIPKNEKVLDLMLKQAFKPADKTSTESSNLGFSDWYDPMLPPSEEHCFLSDNWVIFGVRIDYREVPKALIDIRVKRELKADPNLDKNQLKQQIRDEMIVNYPWIPSVVIAAWHKESGFLICQDGSGKITTSALRELGLAVEDISLVEGPEILLKLNAQTGLSNALFKMPKDRPDGVPEEVGVAIDSTINLSFDDEQNVGISGLGAETKAECDKMIKDGAIIKRMKIRFNTDYAPEPVSLKLALETTKFSASLPYVDSDNRFDRLLDRLKLAQASHYIWTKLQAEVKNA